MVDPPTSFACQVLGDPPRLALVSFDRTTLVSYDEVQATGDELFALQQAEPALHLVLAFQGVQGISSAMLGKLITLHRRVERAGKKLVLCELEPQVGEMFTSSRLNDYFTIRADRAAARALVEA
jgi:anti-sigma B factor antagonist